MKRLVILSTKTLVNRQERTFPSLFNAHGQNLRMLPFEFHRCPVRAFTRWALWACWWKKIGTPRLWPRGPQRAACQHHFWDARGLQDSTAFHSCSLVGFLFHHLWESQCPKEGSGPVSTVRGLRGLSPPSLHPTLNLWVKDTELKKKKNLPPDQALPTMLLAFLHAVTFLEKIFPCLIHFSSSYPAVRLKCPSRWWTDTVYPVLTQDFLCCSIVSLHCREGKPLANVRYLPTS